jgi:hypothetical protein
MKILEIRNQFIGGIKYKLHANDIFLFLGKES